MQNVIFKTNKYYCFYKNISVMIIILNNSICLRQMMDRIAHTFFTTQSPKPNISQKQYRHYLPPKSRKSLLILLRATIRHNSNTTFLFIQGLQKHVLGKLQQIFYPLNTFLLTTCMDKKRKENIQKKIFLFNKIIILFINRTQEFTASASLPSLRQYRLKRQWEYTTRKKNIDRGKLMSDL